MVGFKIGIKILGIFVPWENSKNTATFIIDNNNSKVIRNIIIPKGITVVQKT